VSRREAILSALHGAILAHFQTDPGLSRTDLWRGDGLPAEIPEDGLVILRDGAPGEPEVTLSPLTYHYEHRAEIEILTQRTHGRDAAFDALTMALGQALAADRTLGGLCDWLEAAAPEPADLPIEGAAPIKAAVVPIIIHYSTPDPLG